MVKGRLDKKASTATGYAWFVWIKNFRETSKLLWIPPCRKLLEREDDYISPLSKKKKTNKKLIDQPLLPLCD